MNKSREKYTVIIRSVVIALVIVLSGCSPTNISPNPLPTPAIFSTHNPTVSPTSPTVISTMDQNEAYEILRAYLSDNTLCKLPCWWGITPGQSTFADVQEKIVAFSEVSDYSYIGEASDKWHVANLDINIPYQGDVIGFRSSYLALNSTEVILSVSVRIGGTISIEGAPAADSIYNELLSAYTLPQLASRFGIPLQTFMNADINVAEPTSPDHFIVRLLYPEKGIFVKYEMPLEIRDKSYRFCPSQSVISFELISPEYHDTFNDFFKERGGSEWPITASPYQKTIEETINLTDEEFFQLMSDSPNTCFDSPINIWPEP